MTEPDREDFERVLLDVIPDEPTALSVVVEGFRARTELDPLKTRAAVVEGLKRMLLKAAPVKIGKATKKPRPDIEAAVIEELEVLFFDSESQGWSKLRSSVFAELMERWPDAASAPPGDVLLRRVTPEVSVSEEAQQVILLEAIPSVPTPLRAVIDEFRSRTGLRATAARNRFFGIMAILVVSAAKDVGLDVMNLTEVEIQEIQVRFADLPEDGWLPLSAHSMTHLSCVGRCWRIIRRTACSSGRASYRRGSTRRHSRSLEPQSVARLLPRLLRGRPVATRVDVKFRERWPEHGAC